MWLIKLPFRIIALLIMAVVSVLSIFYSIALHISTLAAGLLYLLLGVCFFSTHGPSPRSFSGLQFWYFWQSC